MHSATLGLHGEARDARPRGLPLPSRIAWGSVVRGGVPGLRTGQKRILVKSELENMHLTIRISAIFVGRYNKEKA